MGVNSPVPKWKQPQQGYTKINKDARLRKEERRRIAGGPCRGDRGTFKGSFFLQLKDVESPLAAEAIALREGITLPYIINGDGSRWRATRRNLFKS
ncbi:hypothetical protein LIER_19566 [Lithospermum erythrorhizon]|uniref:Uncharacterized protein n=1 Tax=Lithospermum erythrorhizon TaxID=34254 RepID=A0AAV3QI94_LITER